MNCPASILLVLDVDSTLIEQEVIEVLASFAGKEQAVRQVTERAMAGELDFAGSLRARVATLKGMPVSIISKALEIIKFTPGAIELIDYVHKHNGKVAAVSGGFVEILEPLSRALALDFYRGNQLEVVDGILTGEVNPPIIDKPAKAIALKEWAEQLGLDLKSTIAIGDGANDLDMMQVAGLSIGFGAKPRVRTKADVLIDSGNLADAIALLGF